MQTIPKFGKVVEEQVLDDDGSTMSIEINYQNYVPKFPKFRHLEYRIRVTNSKEEMTQYLSYCDEKQGKVKSSFHTEHNDLGDSEGWYYVIKKWTEAVRD